MQPIQDKDFDKLFKNAFEDAEVTPSKDLWSSIESKIEPKKKRIVPIYWLSAAAVLLVATVGVLVYQQQGITDPSKKLASNSIKIITPIVEEQQVKDSIKTIVPIKKVETISPINIKSITVLASKKVNTEIKIETKQKAYMTAPEMQKQETTIAKVEEPKQEIIKKKIEQAILQTNSEIVIAANAATVKADEVVGENNQVENKGIRNVGDVVNLIVNKVDKRKEKFIQFRTDDDDSSLSSINIGPFKFGKKSRK